MGNHGLQGMVMRNNEAPAMVVGNNEAPAMEGENNNAAEAMEVDDEEINGPVSSNSNNRTQFKVIKWTNAVMWAWDIHDDNCAICRNLMMHPCIECQARHPANPATDCIIAWGVCNHAFHLHCITRWLNTRQVCPLDNKPWEVQKYGR